MLCLCLALPFVVWRILSKHQEVRSPKLAPLPIEINSKLAGEKSVAITAAENPENRKYAVQTDMSVIVLSAYFGLLRNICMPITNNIANVVPPNINGSACHSSGGFEEFADRSALSPERAPSIAVTINTVNFIFINENTFRSLKAAAGLDLKLYQL